MTSVCTGCARDSVGTLSVVASASRNIAFCRQFAVRADVAQLVEHFTRNEGVGGSSPPVGLDAARWKRGTDRVCSCTGSLSSIHRPPTRITSEATTRRPTSNWWPSGPDCAATAMPSTSPPPRATPRTSACSRPSSTETEAVKDSTRSSPTLSPTPRRARWESFRWASR